jgi:hypothetical protein
MPLKILKLGLINTISVCLHVLIGIYILHRMSCVLNIDHKVLLHNSQCHPVEIAITILGVQTPVGQFCTESNFITPSVLD